MLTACCSVSNGRLCPAAEGLAAGLDYEAALQDPSMVKMDSSAQVTASCWLCARWL